MASVAIPESASCEFNSYFQSFDIFSGVSAQGMIHLAASLNFDGNPETSMRSMLSPHIRPLAEDEQTMAWMAESPALSADGAETARN
jgi:hypothetical protein